MYYRDYIYNFKTKKLTSSNMVVIDGNILSYNDLSRSNMKRTSIPTIKNFNKEERIFLPVAFGNNGDNFGLRVYSSEENILWNIKIKEDSFLNIFLSDCRDSKY